MHPLPSNDTRGSVHLDDDLPSLDVLDLLLDPTLNIDGNLGLDSVHDAIPWTPNSTYEPSPQSTSDGSIQEHRDEFFESGIGNGHSINVFNQESLIWPLNREQDVCRPKSSKSVRTPARRANVKPRISPSKATAGAKPQTRKEWSPEDNAHLLKHAEQYNGKMWGVIAERLGRTEQQCRERYLKVIRPDIKKGPWTEEEDKVLLGLVAEQPGEPNWEIVAKSWPLPQKRTGKQIRQRFTNNFGKVKVKKGKWTKEEITRIREVGDSKKPSWTALAKELSTDEYRRTENGCKNLYHQLKKSPKRPSAQAHSEESSGKSQRNAKRARTISRSSDDTVQNSDDECN